MSTAAPEARVEVILEPHDGARISNLNGPFDANLRTIELGFGVELRNRGNRYLLIGKQKVCDRAADAMRSLFVQTEQQALVGEDIHLAIREFGGYGSDIEEAEAELEQAKPVKPEPVDEGDPVAIRTKRGIIRGRGVAQRTYLKSILRHDVSFGIGPAGTGKTYLAVAAAVDALDRDKVRRLVLVRPAVEAGEKLGFLPGDMAQKIDPYLRPLYDALYEMLGFEQVARLTERSVIEVAPLAFMRGRTLNEAFIILDEAQNTTIEQMKMFLTRIGFGSKAVVTGDVTQVDLPKAVPSGLRHAMQVLKNVDGIGFTYFGAEDVVRHPMVQKIVRAYESYERRAADP